MLLTKGSLINYVPRTNTRLTLIYHIYKYITYTMHIIKMFTLFVNEYISKNKASDKIN